MKLWEGVIKQRMHSIPILSFRSLFDEETKQPQYVNDRCDIVLLWLFWCYTDLNRKHNLRYTHHAHNGNRKKETLMKSHEIKVTHI